MGFSLRMTGAQHAALKSHLFPGDGFEAVALLVCGRAVVGNRHIFTARRVVPVPYEKCSIRRPDRVTWSSDVLDDLVHELWRSGNALVKVHSHPTDYRQFSPFDDQSDSDLSLAWDGLFGEGLPHGSAVMLPDGSLFGRSLVAGVPRYAFESVLVAGDDIKIWNDQGAPPAAEAQIRHEQAFGAGTVQLLQKLRVGVVGCSGTGSVVVELLARLGVGELVLVDPDVVEVKNLNRILNTTAEIARREEHKVHVLARMVESLEQGQRVTPLPLNLDSRAAVEQIAACDVVFGCMDTAEGRNLLNRLATFYLLPYIDVGVGLVADGLGGVDTVAGAVHYVQPGGSTLLDRGLYTMEEVRAEELKRTDPARYDELRRSKYIQGVNEDRPAVITVNMFFATLAVNEMLARIHGFRNMSNAECAVTRGDLCEWILYKEGEPMVAGLPGRDLGRGDVKPLLNRPSLSRNQ